MSTSGFLFINGRGILGSALGPDGFTALGGVPGLGNLFAGDTFGTLEGTTRGLVFGFSLSVRTVGFEEVDCGEHCGLEGSIEGIAAGLAGEIFVRECPCLTRLACGSGLKDDEICKEQTSSLLRFVLLAWGVVKALNLRSRSSIEEPLCEWRCSVPDFLRGARILGASPF